MKIIPETRRTHWIKYLHFIVFDHNLLQQNNNPKLECN